MRVVGLMSGTSADGVDAALVEIVGQNRPENVRVLAHDTFPYPAELREHLLAASYPDSSSVDLLCHLNVAVGECFAAAVLRLVQAAGLFPDDIALIGSHGQTVYHIPVATATPRRSVSTLQIGEPCVIAERTGITTVADFRPRDMAAGGLGAPLAPYGHFVLFAEAEHPRMVQNIGGIANVTVLAGTDPADILAFDTGPGNMLIDEAVRSFSAGRQQYDAEGRIAAEGEVHQALLVELLEHPFLAQAPPKATGREMFGRELWQDILRRSQDLGLSRVEVVSTLTAFTAEAIVVNYERFVFPHWHIPEVVVCGGGASNPTLMRMLRDRLPACAVTTPDDYGYPNAALEAVIFALLAHATIHGQAGNVPRATGARHPVVLGKIVPA
jgi:anhydro-N-acetylmuramic acid kinase